MTLRRFTCTVPNASGNRRLIDVVATWLGAELEPPPSRAAVRRAVVAGAVSVDGRPVRRPGALVRAGSRLEARLDLARLARRDATDGDRAAAIPILFEDDDLVAVAKPAGLVMHATADPQRHDLFTAVRERAGLPYLGLHHRLDVDTSGVVLFTKQERANAALAAQFATGGVRKEYRAIVPRPPKGAELEWRIENRLASVGTGRRARMHEAATGGVRAATEFALIELLESAWLVRALPETGRKHQIRAHLAGAGLPILGDARYGGAARIGRCAAPRVMLHAWSLSLTHPVTGSPLTIRCPYPSDFADTLECLRGSKPGR